MRSLILAVALAGAAPASGQGIARWHSLIAEASARFGVPTSWIERVMRAESAGSTTLYGRPIRSRAGAIGLMQLMPPTWTEMRARLGLGTDPDDPRDNILAGTLYLRLLYDRFGYPGLFGAYNAGPGRYADYLANRQPLPRETTDYLGSVAGASPRPRISPAIPPPPALFALRREGAPPDDRTASNGIPESSLFAIQRHQP